MSIGRSVWFSRYYDVDPHCYAMVRPATGCSYYALPLVSLCRFILKLSASSYKHYNSFGLLYMAAAREMRRSEVIARSPMYANMSEMRKTPFTYADNIYWS